MADDRKINIGCGSQLGTLLFITFLVLKLCKVIDWSWWWVTAPLWIEAIIGLVLLIIWLWIQAKHSCW